jgi:hypothetical protein
MQQPHKGRNRPEHGLSSPELPNWVNRVAHPPGFGRNRVQRKDATGEGRANTIIVGQIPSKWSQWPHLVHPSALKWVNPSQRPTDKEMIATDQNISLRHNFPWFQVVVGSVPCSIIQEQQNKKTQTRTRLNRNLRRETIPPSD